MRISLHFFLITSTTIPFIRLLINLISAIVRLFASRPILHTVITSLRGQIMHTYFITNHTKENFLWFSRFHLLITYLIYHYIDWNSKLMIQNLITNGLRYKLLLLLFCRVSTTTGVQNVSLWALFPFNYIYEFLHTYSVNCS